MNPEEDHNCTEIEYLEQISRFFVSFEETFLQCSRNILSRSLRADVSLVDTKKQRTKVKRWIKYFANNRIEHKDNDVESLIPLIKIRSRKRSALLNSCKAIIQRSLKLSFRNLMKVI